ncbi:MAG: polyprenyl synthetase family protein [Treponema sp.]
MNTEFAQRLEKIEKSLKSFFLPPGEESNSFTGVSYCTSAAFPLLAAPCTDLLLSGGKRWRPLLMILSYELASGRAAARVAISDDGIYGLVPLIEGIHTASLIHDDIEDCSDLRRGKPAAHIGFGLDTALNAGSWLYFQSLSSISSCSAAEIQNDIYRTAIRCIQALHEGQALDIHWHKNPALFPAQADYEHMITGKTGALAFLAAYTGMRMGGAAHTEAEQFAHIAERAGVAFQIADDVKNITSGNAGKKRGDDIVEGKKSLPVILHIEQYPEDTERIIRYFEQARLEGISSNAVIHTIELLERSGAIAAAAQKADAVLQNVYTQLSYIGKDHYAVSLLTDLFSFMQKS